MHKTTGILALSALLAMPVAMAADDGQVFDPMQPTWLRGGNETSSSKPTRTKFMVDTIVVSPERRVAVINGKSVSTGDRVNGAKVLRIEPDAVTLDINGSSLTISLAVTDIKKASDDGG